MIRSDLRQYLIGRSSILALVSSRIYPQEAAEGIAYPRIIYRETGGERTRSLDGANEQVMASFELSCQSTNGDEAKEIADALANVLDCFRGNMNGTTVQGVFVQQGGDSLLPPIAADEVSIKESVITIDLTYESAVPDYV